MILWMAKRGILDFGKISKFFDQKTFFPKIRFIIFFRAMPCQYLSVPRFSVPCRAKIFRAKIFRAGPSHKSAVLRAVPCQSVPVHGLEIHLQE